ncbi:MAG: bifunctional oligoribonuclease/PAP phosphatase NrnA, partial [Phycisphaerae bacterium]|nr:bifunctional oligoribonuclease/PAP phosphatase NrnA [Phycisphaerae bacterium]
VLGNDIKIEDIETKQLDLVVIVDTNSYVQLTEFDKWLKTSKIPVLVIDHHLTGDGLGTVEIVDSTAAATGEIVFDLIKYAGWKITPAIAEALFIAISTDTGWFRFDNTDSRVMRNAAELIDYGAKSSKVYHEMFQNYSPQRLKLLGKMLENLELHCDGKIALQFIMRSDFDATGATGSDTEDFVNECQKISSVEAAALFVELKDGGFRCSLRSNGLVDVRQIASKFGGGGHKVAAGVNLEGPLDATKKMILGEFQKALAGK